MTVREAIRAALALLAPRDRRLLALAIPVQMGTSLLDLAGVLLVGLVGSLAVSAAAGESPPKIVGKVVSALGLGGLSPGALIISVAGGAAFLLMTKSVISPLIMARIFRFLARREALTSARLARALLSRPLTFVNKRSSQETARALIQGTNSATSAVLGQMAVAASEFALLGVLAPALLIINPYVAVGAIVFFGAVGFSLQKVLGRRISRLGLQRTHAEIAALRAVQEAVGSYREITVSDRRAFYVDRIQGLVGQAARASADAQYVTLLPKYISEAAMILGAFVLAGCLFATQPIVVAAGTFALFLAAATRVMPSLLRLQSAALTMRISASSAQPTFALAEDLGYRSGDETEPAEVMGGPRWAPVGGYPDFTPEIVLRDVAFTHGESDIPALEGINLVVRQGQSVAFVGRSGAGKSTLADMILGVLRPDNGDVTLGGLPPTDAVKRWPGGIAYVPQEVMLANDTIRANVALGLPPESVDDEQVWDALRRAHLDDFVRREPESLETQVGERGLRLSGGQRQRLGVARALFTNPRLLVLDEATSALDADTEQAITATLETLDADVTKVIIAHRLSTIRHVDVVVYLEEGRILAAGSFDEMFSRVPALRRQAASVAAASVTDGISEENALSGA